VALLISAHPELHGQVDQIETTIEQSALHISWTGCSSSGVPNNAYGWGRIDALAAVGTVNQLQLEKVASTVSVLPGDLITYTLTVTNSHALHSATNVVLTDKIPPGSAFVSATIPYTLDEDVIRWDFTSLTASSTINVELVVRVDLTTSDSLTNADYSVYSDQAALVQGAPVTTWLGRIFFLPIAIKTP
jgi:uncharacterized repeat protein (TIGR01451 family)